jgi:hypothetical protein
MINLESGRMRMMVSMSALWIEFLLGSDLPKQLMAFIWEMVVLLRTLGVNK